MLRIPSRRIYFEHFATIPGVVPLISRSLNQENQIDFCWNDNDDDYNYIHNFPKKDPQESESDSDDDSQQADNIMIDEMTTPDFAVDDLKNEYFESEKFNPNEQISYPKATINV